MKHAVLPADCGDVNIFIGDTHGGSQVALFPREGVRLDEGAPVMPTADQMWLLDRLDEFCATARQLARGRVVNLFAGGDLTNGEPKDTYQNWTRDRNIQMESMTVALAPLLDMATNIYVLRGTPAHVGPLAQYDEALAHSWHDMGYPVQRPATGERYSWWDLWLPSCGVLIHAQHHARGTRSARLRNTPAVRLASDMIDVCTDAGWRVPRLVVRWHSHAYHDSYTARPTCRAIYCPGWSLAPDYTFKDSVPSLPQIGGILAFTRDGVLEDVKAIWHYPPPPRTCPDTRTEAHTSAAVARGVGVARRARR